MPLVDKVKAGLYPLGFEFIGPYGLSTRFKVTIMKVKSSLKSLKNRHKDCKLVRRKGRLYVINKTQGRFKARQG